MLHKILALPENVDIFNFNPIKPVSVINVLETDTSQTFRKRKIPNMNRKVWRTNHMLSPWYQNLDQKKLDLDIHQKKKQFFK